MRPFGHLGVIAFGFMIFGAFPSWAGVDDSSFLLSAESLATFETAAGAPMNTYEPTSRARSVFKSYPIGLVRKIQQGLADQGFYLGPIDGQFGPKTENAIRAYQKSADLYIDGLPTSQLALDLETGGKVGLLLNRLKKNRNKASDAARKLLLSRPETRYLVEGADANKNARHDSKTCMAKPEPKCLLIEASISAGDIEKSEMRDWALGEILTAQAKAGLATDAINTTRRIHDPRLIMVALRDIAKAQAAAGENDAAMAAVDIIPDLTQQVEAYVAIAEIQANLGQIKEAKTTGQHLAQYLQRIASPLTRITFYTRISVILYKAGETKAARKYIKTAEELVRSIRPGNEHDEGLRYIAGAYAENNAPSKAMDVLKNVENGANDVPVLIAAATGLAQAGAATEALITAENIEAVRYRALVLARIASYQAGAGDLKSARTTLEKALTAAKTIRFPFAKAYAYSRIAMALNDVGISAGNEKGLLQESLNTTALIKDERLKAHIYWTIADARRDAGDEPGAKTAQKKAETATADIKSPFSRVWMLSDIAQERARRNELDAAWAIFKDALDEAKSITHPWGRARALSKVAGTMTFLMDRTNEIASRP